MKKQPTLLEKIDDLLPQTQCQLCEYSGCKPYAEAILYKNERIDKCLPGGVETLKQLAELTGQEAEPYIPGMLERQKPAVLVEIDEDICIGCKKCIQVCPVDAILGAPKVMHSVIRDECTGCELCIPACPVDCIYIKPIDEPSIEEKKACAKKAKERYEFRNMRLKREKMEASERHRKLKFSGASSEEEKVLARRKEIQAAVERVRKLKK